jgi:hypothetical protein
MRSGMIPYILIISGGVLLVAGIGMLVKRPASVVEKPATVITDAVQGKETAVPARLLADDNVRKGHDFEKWAVDHTSRKYWKMVEWQGDKYHDGRYAESNRHPDLLFRVNDRDEEHLVALECKWRNGFNNDRIVWASAEQIEIYNRFARERKANVFVVIGVGGRPEAPAEVYTVPLMALKYPDASRNYLQAFRSPDLNGLFYFDFAKMALSLGRHAK